MNSADNVVIHGKEWKQSDVKEQIEFCLTKKWSLANFKKPNHDHCEICWWTLVTTEDENHSVGYTDGYRWLCRECYHQFIESADSRFASNCPA